MYAFHTDKPWYFEMQCRNAREYVIPFVEPCMAIGPGCHVLEVGCAEGGVLKAFVERGCTGVGVELEDGRLVLASQFMEKEMASGAIRLINRDIQHPSFLKEFRQHFDLIVLKDVIEHIPNQENLLPLLGSFLKPGGKIFFGFPPWCMPFGGHQQVCVSILSRIPYVHLLPMGLYRSLLRLFGEKVEPFLEIKETGLSTHRFERIVRQTGLRICAQTHYLINPIYRFKFKLKPRIQYSWIRAIPYLRDFVTTCVYYLVEVAPEKS